MIQVTLREGLLFTIDTANPPFALPADSREIAIDLPFPTSVNRIWRVNHQKIIRSTEYKKWLQRADQMVLLHRSYPRPKLTGKFEATLLFDEDLRRDGDLDNREKAVLDWLVSREIITDDRYLERKVTQWVPHERAPHGCMVTLRSWHG